MKETTYTLRVKEEYKGSIELFNLLNHVKACKAHKIGKVIRTSLSEITKLSKSSMFHKDITVKTLTYKVLWNGELKLIDKRITVC